MVTWGRDTIGVFRIFHLPVKKTEPCKNCHQSVTTVIHYSDPVMPHGIRVEDTILSKGDLGVDCGCYGKLHRQVAHITDKINQRRH